MLPERAFQSLGGRMTLEGGGKGGSAPPAPDYRGAAIEQAQSGKENLAMQTAANRPTMNTPWGRMDWSQSAGVDAGTGTPITNWTGNLTLNPQEQAALDSQQRIQQGRSGAAETLLGQATGAFQKAPAWDKLPGMQTLDSVGYDPANARQNAQNALYQQQVRNLEPMLTQSEDARRTRLANMGISPEGGSEAWNRAQSSMDATRTKAYQDASLSSITGGGAEAQRELQLATGAMGAGNQTRQQAIAEMAQQRNMPLNELNALLTGQQVNQPQMPSFNSAGVAPATGFQQAAGQQGQANQFAQSQDGGMDIGGLIGTGVGMYFGGPAGAAAGGALLGGQKK